MENNIPKLMTIKEVAATGILSEYCIRTLIKQGKLPVIFSGRKALINYTVLCNHLNSLAVNL